MERKRIRKRPSQIDEVVDQPRSSQVKKEADDIMQMHSDCKDTIAPIDQEQKRHYGNQFIRCQPYQRCTVAAVGERSSSERFSEAVMTQLTHCRPGFGPGPYIGSVLICQPDSVELFTIKQPPTFYVINVSDHGRPELIGMQGHASGKRAALR